VEKASVEGKRVLLRAGFDVPLKKNGNGSFVVADENRIKASLPTLKYLLNNKAKIVILSHLDRPEGKFEADKSMWPVAVNLAKHLSYKAVNIVDWLPDYFVPHLYFLGEDITKKDYSSLSKKIKPGDILFLENLRFYPGEQKSEKGFADCLAKYGEIYVDEAFSVAHRKDCSIATLPGLMQSFAGIELVREIKALNRLTSNPASPFVVIMGGAKVDDKVGVINNLAPKADKVLVAGAIANAFLKSLGYEIGKSKSGEELVARELYRNYKEKIVLPVDVVVSRCEDGKACAKPIDKVQSHETIYDIGPKTIKLYDSAIKTAKTIVWNGPLGKIEIPRFAYGSKAIARSIAATAKGTAFGVVGGGETAEVVDAAHVGEFIDHISTGGGAMLEFLAGKKLPGIEALSK
jgi:3-phosphoglycerate kinase